MTHYICTGGCEGVSESPGTCQAEECEKHGEPLTKCECTDSNHGDGKDAEEETED